MTTPKPINIAKVKTTRGGSEYHHYETFNGMHWGRIKWPDEWELAAHHLDGRCASSLAKDSLLDLVEEKTWRSWRKNDKKPKKIMVRWKAGAEDDDDTIIDIEKRNVDSLLEQLFNEAIWIHEDKSETFCGIEE